MVVLSLHLFRLISRQYAFYYIFILLLHHANMRQRGYKKSKYLKIFDAESVQTPEV